MVYYLHNDYKVPLNPTGYAMVDGIGSQVKRQSNISTSPITCSEELRNGVRS